MFFDSPLWNGTMILLGEATVLIVVVLLATALILLVIALVSVRRGHLYLPRIMKPGFFLLEGLVKAICRFFGLDDRDLISFSIKLQNSMNKKSFEAVPVEKRAVFLPQCLRSARCPANLTPEGIWCQGCGLCTTGEAIRESLHLGYRVFIVPGSSFIKRMVKKVPARGDHRGRLHHRGEGRARPVRPARHPGNGRRDPEGRVRGDLRELE